jgi:hypothetical protein
LFNLFLVKSSNSSPISSVLRISLSSSIVKLSEFSGYSPIVISRSNSFNSSIVKLSEFILLFEINNVDELGPSSFTDEVSNTSWISLSCSWFKLNVGGELGVWIFVK